MEAGVRTIRDLLSPNEQYVIPFFQRSYAWKKKERELLWEDIIRLCDDKSHKLTHFLGPVVSSSSGNQVPGSTRSYLLIDGQQRLTTLTIFLIAIRDVALEREDDELAETILEDYLINKRAKGNQQYKLLPRYHDAAALISLVRGENQSAHKSKEIYKAWRDAKKWAHQFSDDDTTSLKELFISITDRLSLVVISIDKEDPYEIFEGLNNRGQALQESDLIRNFVFMQVPLEEQQQFNDEYWKRFEDTFDVEKTSSQKQSVFF